MKRLCPICQSDVVSVREEHNTNREEDGTSRIIRCHSCNRASREYVPSLAVRRKVSAIDVMRIATAKRDDGTVESVPYKTPAERGARWYVMGGFPHSIRISVNENPDHLLQLWQHAFDVSRLIAWSDAMQVDIGMRDSGGPYMTVEAGHGLRRYRTIVSLRDWEADGKRGESIATVFFDCGMGAGLHPLNVFTYRSDGEWPRGRELDIVVNARIEMINAIRHTMSMKRIKPEYERSVREWVYQLLT